VPLSVIAAVASNRVIGNRGRLPWRLPDDLARFRRLTMGHAVLMGHATQRSLPRPLAGRRNVVLTRDRGLHIPGFEMARSPEEALRMTGGDEAFVIGGAEIYALFLPLAEKMYLTMVDAEVPGDVLFPEVQWEKWRVTAEEPGTLDDASTPPHRFVDYQRISP
jgi:dihydrofolate reductase